MINYYENYFNSFGTVRKQEFVSKIKEYALEHGLPPLLNEENKTLVTYLEKYNILYTLFL